MNMEVLKLCSSRAPFEIKPHSGSVYPHRGCLCHEEMRGGTPDNRGALKVVLCEKEGGGLVNMEPLKLYSGRALFGIDPHSGSVYLHRSCLCYEGMEGGLQDCTGHYRKKSERDVVALRDFLTSNCSTSIRVWTCTKCSWSDDRLPLGYLLPDFQQI